MQMGLCFVTHAVAIFRSQDGDIPMNPIDAVAVTAGSSTLS